MPARGSARCRRASLPRRRSRAAVRMNPDRRRLQEYVSSLNTQLHRVLLMLDDERRVIRYRGESQTKARASSQIALHFNCAAELGYDLIDDNQFEACAMSSI